MAEVRKILGQVDMAATTTITACKVDASKEVIVSSVVFCNRGAAAVLSAYVVSAGDSGEAADQYLYWDLALPADDTFVATLGITLSAGDEIRGAASSTAAGSAVTMTVFGVEIS